MTPETNIFFDTQDLLRFAYGGKWQLNIIW